MTYLAFVFEYEPPGLVVTEESILKMVEESDFCVFAPGGIPIGTKVRIGPDMLDGEGKTPKVGSSVQCVAHKYMGKVVVLQDVSS